MADATASPRPASAPTVALLWMSGALLSFSLVAVGGREAAKGVDTFTIMFWRCVIAIVILTAIAFATRMSFRRDIATSVPGLHVVRNIVHYGAQYAWLAALTMIPLAQLFAVEFTAPLLVAMLAPLILNERLTPVRILAGLIGFAGIVFIVRPGAVPISDGLLFGLASALGFAFNMIATKWLTRTETPFKLLFWMQVLQIGIGLVPMWSRWAIPDPVTCFWLLVVGLAALSAHFCLVKAFARADAIFVAPLDFLRLPLIMGVGFWLYHEPFDPNVTIGGAIIIGANALNMWGEWRARRQM
jgi:drug/metabolite transporter (DMT)-like permease